VSTETTSELAWLPTDSNGHHLPRIGVKFTAHGREYAYAWGGPQNLQIGDMVKAPRPPNWNGSYYSGEARVSALRSGYEGPVRTITEFIRKATNP
jgi:hypothetical protein